MNIDTLNTQRKLNDALNGGDWPTTKELTEAFNQEQLADKLLKYLGKVIALREMNNLVVIKAPEKLTNDSHDKQCDYCTNIKNNTITICAECMDENYT